MIVRAQSQLAVMVCEKLDGSHKTASPLAMLFMLSSSTRNLRAMTSSVWPGFRQHILHTMASMIWLLKKMYGKGEKSIKCVMMLSGSWLSNQLQQSYHISRPSTCMTSGDVTGGMGMTLSRKNFFPGFSDVFGFV